MNNLQENAVGFTVYYRVFLWEIDGETMGTVTDFIFLCSKITADADCNHEIKMLTPWKKTMTNLDVVLKRRNVTLLTKVLIVKAMVFPVVIVWM